MPFSPAAVIVHDSLSLHVAFSVVADRLGLDVADDHIVAAGAVIDGVAPYRMTDMACMVLSDAGRGLLPGDPALVLAEVPLACELVNESGDIWQNEADAAAEAAVAARFAALSAIAEAGRSGASVWFDTAHIAAPVLAGGFPSPTHAHV